MRVEVEVAGLDLGEVEDVVEQAEQAACGAFALDGVVALAGVQRRLLQQAQHAEHRIHRRANLVAHIGQEARLGLRGAFGGQPRLGLRREVEAGQDHATVGQGGGARLDEAAAGAMGLEAIGPAVAAQGQRGLDRVQRLLALAVVAARGEEADQIAEAQLGFLEQRGRHVEQALEFGVVNDEAAFGVEDREAAGQVGDDLAHQRAAGGRARTRARIRQPGQLPGIRAIPRMPSRHRSPDPLAPGFGCQAGSSLGRGRRATEPGSPQAVTGLP